MEKLENKILLAADVYGPPIPEGHVYPEPILLLRPGQVLPQLPESLPEVAPTNIKINRAGLAGQDVYDEVFASYVQDGTFDLDDARDWLTGMDDNTGYNRFEIVKARNEVNDPANLPYFTPESFYLITEVVNDAGFVYNDADFIEVGGQVNILHKLLDNRE
jgi:hypothetical protein